MRSLSRITGTTVLSGLLLASLASPSWGVEPAQEFLDELLNRGYTDIAIEYLDKAKNSPAVPVAFKKTYLYQRGKALMKGAEMQRDQALREKTLNEAHQTFSKFIEEQPDNNLALDCRSQLGNVVVERARMRMEKAKKLDDKTALHTEARNLYNEGLKIFTDLEKEVVQELEKFPKQLDEKRDKEKIERRDQFRKDYLQAQLLVGATKEEASLTFDAKSPDRKKYLEEAGKMYAEIYDKYRTRLAGLYARMYQARCEQKLGKHKEAMSFLTDDIFSQPDQPDAFRTLKIKGTILAMESWGALNQHAEAVSKGLAIIDKARPTEDKTSEFMELRLSTAKAIVAYMDELKKKNPSDKELPRLKKDGNKLVQMILRFPNDYQNDARPLLASFAGTAADATARTEPKTFDEALQLGRESISAMQTATSTVRALQGRLASAQAAQKDEITKQIGETKKTEETSRDDAMYYFTAAQGLITKETPDESISLVLYMTCFLKYMQEEYYAAVVLGEFVAHRYPASAGARQCAKIALASYLKLFGLEESDDKSFESERIVDIADFIVQKWPDQPEAEEALNTLIPFMIKERQLDRAQAYLDKISVESPHRGTAELKTGQALWSTYLEGSREVRNWETGTVEPPAGTDIAKKKADLEPLKARAQATLVDGVTRMQKSGEVTPVVATAALSLAQIYIDTNQPTKAIALLEDPKIGPLTLLEKKNEIMTRPGLPEETYKSALRAYISSLAAGGSNSDQVVQKAKGIMENLKATVGSTEDGQRKLIVTYVGLARDLQTQMENSTPEVRAGLGTGFEAFLDQVGKDANDLNILNWVGETYRAMSESFVTKKGEVPPEGQKYLQKAQETFSRILAMGEKDKAFLPGEMATQIRLQLAKTYRQMNKPKEAVDLFEGTLKERNLLLPVQVEAAYTYVEWAEVFARTNDKENAIKYYRSAMIGARPDKTNPNKLKQTKNIIWGWGEMARMTASNPKFSDAFHEARVNLSVTRYKMALLMKEPEKTEQLKQVKAEIKITLGLYPTLGGDKWRAQYDKVLKDTQLALKQKPIGLAEFESVKVTPAVQTPPTTPSVPAATTATTNTSTPAP